MLEGVLNTFVFRLHLRVYCVIKTKHLIGYFECSRCSRIIYIALNIPKNCTDNVSSKSQKRQRLFTFILVNTIKFPRSLKNNMYHSNKRGPAPFFPSDTTLHFVDNTTEYQNGYFKKTKHCRFSEKQTFLP